jgi:hypothetical protein
MDVRAKRGGFVLYMEKRYWCIDQYIMSIPWMPAF